MFNKTDPITGSNIDLNEYSNKMTNATSISGTDIEKMLHDAGVNGDSFEAFYYIITEVFMHQKGDAKESEIEATAQILNRLNLEATELTATKDYFFKCGPHEIYSAFFTHLSNFLKELLKDFDPPEGFIGISDFLSIMEMVKKEAATDPDYYNKHFPGIGSQILTVADSLKKISDNMYDLRFIWQDEDQSRAALKQCQDGFSEIQSQFTSISVGEGARIEYKQNEYNQLMAFVKGMLAEFQKIKQLALKNWVSR